MLGDTNGDFKRKLLGKTEEKVRGYRSVALSHYCGNGYAFCVMISRKLGLGMRRADIARKFDEIVAFAEVEKFIDTPVKHYSSGMYMRLAFAVAAHLEPEILIVDEVLAVRDAEFQKKCLGKMGDVAKGGRTVLFVSHNMHAIKSLCTQGIMLQSGRVFFAGSAAACVSSYLDAASAEAGTRLVASPDTRAGSGEWRFTEVAATKLTFAPDESKEFIFHVSPTGTGAGPIFFSGLLVNEEGTILTQLDSRLIGFWVRSPQPVRGRLSIAGLWLMPTRGNLIVANHFGIPPNWISCSSSPMIFCAPLGNACKFRLAFPIQTKGRSTGVSSSSSSSALANVPHSS